MTTETKKGSLWEPTVNAMHRVKAFTPPPHPPLLFSQETKSWFAFFHFADIFPCLLRLSLHHNNSFSLLIQLLKLLRPFVTCLVNTKVFTACVSFFHG